MSSVFPEPNPFSASLYEKLRRHPKRIVFAEGADPRVVRVAARMCELQIGVPILIGRRDLIEKAAAADSLELPFAKIIEPRESSDFQLFCDYYERAEAARGNRVANVEDAVAKPQNFAAMMVQYGQADGMVAGNDASPAMVFRAAMHLIKPLTDASHVFAATVLYSKDLPHFGHDGLLVLGDTRVIDQPTPDELGFIAVETGKLARHLMGKRPHIAMLSHSTQGSAPTDSSRRVLAGLAVAQRMIDEQALELDIDGELQADVALDAACAEVHLPSQAKLEPSDVLVFPNLDAANIAVKLLHFVAGATKYGQLLMGLTKPVAQVSKVASEATILRTAAMIGVEAIKFNQMHLDGEV